MDTHIDIFKYYEVLKVNNHPKKMIWGLPSELGVLESVCPECAILYSEGQSDTDIVRLDVVLQNRSDACDSIERNTGSEMIESGNDANSIIDYGYICLCRKEQKARKCTLPWWSWLCHWVQ